MTRRFNPFLEGGMPSYRVVAPQIVVEYIGGGQDHFNRGATVPKNAEPRQIEHLLAHGLVEEIGAAQ